jgi:hypothetical protein
MRIILLERLYRQLCLKIIHMKRLLILFLVCFSGITAFAQNAVVQSPAAVPPKQDFWTPQNLWILIISVLITGFILLIMHTLSSATISLAREVEKKHK